jgi:hypothetical protein
VAVVILGQRPTAPSIASKSNGLPTGSGTNPRNYSTNPRSTCLKWAAIAGEPLTIGPRAIASAGTCPVAGSPPCTVVTANFSLRPSPSLRLNPLLPLSRRVSILGCMIRGDRCPLKAATRPSRLGHLIGRRSMVAVTCSRTPLIPYSKLWPWRVMSKLASTASAIAPALTSASPCQKSDPMARCIT